MINKIKLMKNIKCSLGNRMHVKENNQILAYIQE